MMQEVWFCDDCCCCVNVVAGIGSRCCRVEKYILSKNSVYGD